MLPSFMPLAESKCPGVSGVGCLQQPQMEVEISRLFISVPSCLLSAVIGLPTKTEVSPRALFLHGEVSTFAAFHNCSYLCGSAKCPSPAAVFIH